MEAFGSKSGKRVTALDRYDDTKFQTDASLLPRQSFNSKQGITDLLELTGSRAPVVQAGRDFATNELGGMTTSEQVRNWMTKRREMLGMLPEVRDSVLKYANALQHGETISRSADLAVTKLQKVEAAKLR